MGFDVVRTAIDESSTNTDTGDKYMIYLVDHFYLGADVRYAEPFRQYRLSERKRLKLHEYFKEQASTMLTYTEVCTGKSYRRT